ncbi:transmembrane emp24 domain-containing protein p24beta3 [Dorcoceras hygrometricum]|uniref:Transmembrane emp24 domain-containing protein p24beta3 n=1 Tax=Dorcoceras hygrometricum TaxID=472368 RepID=A0A2Z7DBP2_9LAMI|nr:transmembrane emp24 domain-containing protein p24beta3 [Dorcoceras hygrometricum]
MESGRRLRSASAASTSSLSFLFLIFLGGVSALSVTVNNVECVYEYVFREGDSVSGNFVAVDHDVYWPSDDAGIDFTVTSPDGNIVHTLKGTAEDKFEFKAPKSGMYKFCFHNPYPTPETVSFYIHVGHFPDKHNLAKDEHLDPINVKIAELGEALEYITTEQRYLKAKAARHRRTNESTRRRVIFYSVGEYILLALVSGLQVLYIRRMFSRSVAYGRV